MCWCVLVAFPMKNHYGDAKITKRLGAKPAPLCSIRVWISCSVHTMGSYALLQCPCPRTCFTQVFSPPISALAPLNPFEPLDTKISMPLRWACAIVISFVKRMPMCSSSKWSTRMAPVLPRTPLHSKVLAPLHWLIFHISIKAPSPPILSPFSHSPSSTQYSSSSNLSSSSPTLQTFLRPPPSLGISPPFLLPLSSSSFLLVCHLSPHLFWLFFVDWLLWLVAYELD